MNWFGLLSNLYLLRQEPVSLVHFVTEQCNLRCPHCFLDFSKKPAPSEMLRLQEIERMVAAFGPMLFNVYLTGGEPFLREDLEDIVAAYAKKRSLHSIFIASNGFFTERIREVVSTYRREQHSPRLFITLSIDELEDQHDAHRGAPGLFRRAMDSYQWLDSLNDPKIQANIALTVTPQNANRAESIYRALRNDYSVRSVTAIAMREQGVVKPIDRKAREFIWRGYARLTKSIMQDMDKDPASGYRTGILGYVINSKNRLFYSMLRGIYIDSRYISRCPAGSLFGVVRANGDVYPCEALTRKLGNIRDYGLNLSALWNAPSAKECRQWIQKSHCHCSYECAWSINLLSHGIYLPRLMWEGLRSYFKRGRQHA